MHKMHKKFTGHNLTFRSVKHINLKQYPMLVKQIVIFIALYHIGHVTCQSSLYSVPEYSIREPSYIIVAPRVVRPAEKIRISCTIMNKHWNNLMVKALIFTDEQEIVSGIQEFLPNVPNTIAMTMPNNIRQANYYLRVQGKLPTGETTFSDQKSIIFEQKAVSIIVQLERPDYRQESILRFRCIPMYPDLSAYLGTMDVFIIAPSGIIIKRWENVQTNAGVVSLSYIFNDAPPPGVHTVKCSVMGYEATKNFEMFEFYQWKYEVNVSMPHYFLTTSPAISGVVVANYTTGRAVFGTCRIKAIVKPAVVSIHDLEGYPYLERYIEQFNGVVDFHFAMSELLAISGQSSLNELEVYVEAQVDDPYFNEKSNGSFITTLYDPRIQLKFLGDQPKAFKPRMPYTTYIAVSQQDGTPLPVERIPNSYVRLRIETSGGSSFSNQQFLAIEPMTSICQFSFTPDSNTEYVSLIASFVENDFEDPQTVVRERAIRYKSPTNSFIFVSSSTVEPQVGDFMIFTVRVSQPVDQVHYHIVSSSRIVHTDVLQMNNKQKTFDVGLTREMVPSAHILAYYIKYDGELVADSYNFHVNASSIQNKVNITINRRKDFTGDTVEILAYASAQSFVGLAALDESIVRLYNGGNIITELMLYDELYTFDTNANTSVYQTWNTELGFAAHRFFYASQSYAYDAASTFAYTGLVVFSDLALFDSLSEARLTCNESGLVACVDGSSCYSAQQRCDRVCQCERDCSDETGCAQDRPYFRPLHERFQPKIERIYQLSWLWKDSFTLPDGRVQFRAEVSKDIANYVVGAFAMSRLSGFGVLKVPGRISTTRQFYVQVEMPPECRLGEQVGVRVDVFNFQASRIEGLIILQPSDDYRFVNVEKDGLVSSFAPRLTTGEHHVLVIIQPGESRRVHIPIVARRSGTIQVRIDALTGANRDTYMGTMQVYYEGVTNVFHSPYLLSLVNMPRMVSEFEIVTNQTFILPLQQIWSFIPGSATAQVAITGDVCGPFFYLGLDNFVAADSYLKKSFGPIEAGIFSFGTMLNNLMYMRQGHGGRNFNLNNVIKVLEWANHEYQRIITTFEGLGWFNQYGVPNTESIWVTSWAITVIKEAVDPVWEQYGLFIDPELLNSTVIWLVSQQNAVNGSWGEIGPVYDRKFESNWTKNWDGSDVKLNLSLTAQCLIALKVNSDIRGQAAKLVSNAVNKARMYLELHFTKITDSFERAIVTYALHLTNSPIKDLAFQVLIASRHKNDYGIYWSNWQIPRMKIYWPSKNPRHNWKPESNHEGHAVAATAYALLTHIYRAEQQNKYEIMTWLQTQRNYIGGMSSTYDSLLAHKALVLYAIGTGDSIQNYNMNINFTSSSSNDLDVNYVTINDSNIIQLQQYDIQNVWGNLLVDGQGTGYALVQLKVEYNVEYPWLIRKPPYEAFNMSVHTQLYGRNFSHIDYHVCLSWLPQNLQTLGSNKSGHAQFQIQIPTGYRVEERWLKEMITYTRNLGDGENAPGPTVNFLFDYLDLEPVCFTFTAIRYIPVANLSRYYEMKVFEYHEPGNANRSMYYLRDIFGLDICEVCGSYQCPYCPHYAFALSIFQASPLVILSFICVSFIFVQSYFFDT